MSYSRAETSFQRGALALFVGAFVGAIGVTLASLMPLVWAYYSGSRVAEYLVPQLWVLGLILTSAFGVFAFGLVFVGAPVWAIMHRLGLRHSVYAIVLGFMLTFAVVIAPHAYSYYLREPDRTGHSFYGDAHGKIMVDGKLTPYGWEVNIRNAAYMALLGGFVGWVVWLVAYRRPRQGKLSPPS